MSDLQLILREDCVNIRVVTHKLEYIEEYKTILEARIREKQIKSYKSKIYIEKLIEMGR